ncbi:MAG: hypothetical protein ACK4FG_01925 [Brevundimonas sp.]
MLRVHLVGAYSDFHDGPIEVSASTAWEAVEAVVCQLKGFLPDATTGRKILQVIGFKTVEDLKTPLEQTDIYVMPALAFGKEGGLTQILIGVALVAVSFVLPGMGLALHGMTLGAMVAGVGVGAIIGGLLQVITPQPKLGSGNEEEVRSKYLSGIANTTQIGTPIALLYGKRKIGGHILSLNIDAKATGS